MAGARQTKHKQQTPGRSVIRALLIGVWEALDDRNLGLIAAGVAFYAMLAVFPGLAVTIAIWGFFSDPGLMRDNLSMIEEFVPHDGYVILLDEVTRLVSVNGGALGWATAISLLIGLYSAHNGVLALVSGLNAVHAREPHPGLTRYLISLVLTVAMIGLLITTLATVVLVPTLLNWIPLGPAQAWLLKVIPVAILFVAVLVFLGMFYRWGPNQPDARHGWVTPGAFLAALFWAASSVAFSVYLANFSTYNRVYGSIGAVIALLMWFYLSAYIILLGGVVNAELARLRRFPPQ
jgi:membrane protein